MKHKYKKTHHRHGYLNIAEMASALQIGYSLMHYYISSGFVPGPSKVFGPGGRKYYDAADVLAIMAAINGK